MEEIKIIETKNITSNSSISIISINGVKYAFTEAIEAEYCSGCPVSIHTNLVKL